MKCPKCGNTVDSVRVNQITALAGNYPHVLACIAYVCPNTKCEAVLGVETDPTKRDARLHAIEEPLKALKKFLDTEQVKSSNRAQVARLGSGLKNS